MNENKFQYGISVHHLPSDITYDSDMSVLGKDEQKAMEELASKSVKGEISCLYFNRDGEKVTIGKEILIHSVITVTKQEVE